MKKISILDGQDIYGTRYPDLVKLYQAHEAGAWTEFEVSLSQDTAQYYKLDPVRRSIFENCIRMFTQADKDVCDGYLPLIQYYKNNDKDNGKLEQSLLNAPPGPVNTVSLTEYTTQSPTSNLEQDGANYCNGEHNLCDIKIHLFYNSSSFFFIKSFTTCGLARPLVIFIT